jgi:hypothetical protein
LTETYPDESLPILGWAIGESERLSTGSRLEAVVALTRAAALLAGQLDDLLGSVQSKTKSIESKSDTSPVDLETEINERYKSVAAGTTTITHPRKLAISRSNRQRTRFYKKNRFADYIALLVTPLESALQEAALNERVLLGNITSQLPSLSHLQSNGKDVDGVVVIIPSQVLHGLATMVRCAYNTPVHEDVAARALVAFECFRGAKALSLRRAAATCALSVVEGWLHRRRKPHTIVRPTSALESLTSVTAASPELASPDASELDTSVAQNIDWCASQLREESDVDLLILYRRIVSAGIEVAEMTI